jgi:hypothetical protein
MPARRTILWPLLSIIAVFWIVMMGTLVQRTRTALPPEIGARGSLLGEELGPEARWMGVYLQGEKIGYAVTSIERRPDGTVKLVDRSVIRLPVADVIEEVVTRLDYIARSDGSLDSFSFRMTTGQHHLAVAGRVEGRHLLATLTTAGDTTELTFPLSEETFLPASLELFLGGRPLEPGKTYSFPLFDPVTLSQERAHVIVAGTEILTLEGEKVETTKIEITFLGITQMVWLDEHGRTVKEEAPMGLVMVWEQPETAVAWGEEDERLDLLTLYAIETEEKVARPREVAFLRAAISGFDPGQLDLEGGRQRLVSEEPCLLEVTAAAPRRIDGAGVDYDRAAFGADLLPSPLVQSAHPEIARRARAILRDASGSGGARTVDRWIQARRVSEWVYRHLTKVPTASVPSALDVLQTLEGDCNEHAVLFAALLRAVGIPAKIMLGVVYQEGAFYYHAWNRVYVGEWIDMDATFGQDVADATHIALLEGDLDQLPRIVGLIGRLDIDILEYRYK